MPTYSRAWSQRPLHSWQLFSGSCNIAHSSEAPCISWQAWCCLAHLKVLTTVLCHSGWMVGCLLGMRAGCMLAELSSMKAAGLQAMWHGYWGLQPYFSMLVRSSKLAEVWLCSLGSSLCLCHLPLMTQLRMGWGKGGENHYRSYWENPLERTWKSFVLSLQ